MATQPETTPVVPSVSLDQMCQKVLNLLQPQRTLEQKTAAVLVLTHIPGIVIPKPETTSEKDVTPSDVSSTFLEALIRALFIGVSPLSLFVSKYAGSLQLTFDLITLGLSLFDKYHPFVSIDSWKLTCVDQPTVQIEESYLISYKVMIDAILGIGLPSRRLTGKYTVPETTDLEPLDQLYIRVVEKVCTPSRWFAEGKKWNERGFLYIKNTPIFLETALKKSKTSFDDGVVALMLKELGWLNPLASTYVTEAATFKFTLPFFKMAITLSDQSTDPATKLEAFKLSYYLLTSLDVTDHEAKKALLETHKPPIINTFFTIYRARKLPEDMKDILFEFSRRMMQVASIAWTYPLKVPDCGTYDLLELFVRSVISETEIALASVNRFYDDMESSNTTFITNTANIALEARITQFIRCGELTRDVIHILTFFETLSNLAIPHPLIVPDKHLISMILKIGPAVNNFICQLTPHSQVIDTRIVKIVMDIVQRWWCEEGSVEDKAVDALFQLLPIFATMIEANYNAAENIFPCFFAHEHVTYRSLECKELFTIMISFLNLYDSVLLREKMLSYCFEIAMEELYNLLTGQPKFDLEWEKVDADVWQLHIRALTEGLSIRTKEDFSEDYTVPQCLAHTVAVYLMLSEGRKLTKQESESVERAKKLLEGCPGYYELKPIIATWK